MQRQDEEVRQSELSDDAQGVKMVLALRKKETGVECTLEEALDRWKEMDETERRDLEWEYFRFLKSSN